MRAVLAYALARARVRRGRQLLAMLGIAAAGAMLGASVTVAVSLSGGFSRTAARADLPDVLTTFAAERQARVAGVVSELANVRAASYVLESSGIGVSAGGFFSDQGSLVGVQPGGRRPGYALVAGHDVDGPDQVVVEQGLARAWHLRLGQRVELAAVRSDGFRIVGVAVPPDTVAFPLAHSPRLYVSYREAARLTGTLPGVVNGADLWLVDPGKVDVTLAQARSAAYGVRDLKFVTRAGLGLLIGQAAGIVIAVLVAFSVIALAVVAAMLSASAAAEVQRRLAALGLLRAIGVSRRGLVAGSALEAAIFALPAGTAGVLAGALLVGGPVDRLLASLNELPPGASLWLVLAGSVAALTGLVVAATCWPTWRAGRRPPVEVLRGADVSSRGRWLPLPGALPLLGVRLLAARPARTAATVAIVGFAVSVVLAILAIASVLEAMNRQPLSVGKRYQLLVEAPVSELGRIRRLPAVAAATPLYQLEVADSFSLDEAFALFAFGSPPSQFEAPPLSEGRRATGPGEADLGVGLAQSLGLHPGGVLAVQLPTGKELRFTVAGIVQALEDQGRVAYVRAPRVLAAEPSLPAQIAVRLRPGASSASVTRALARRGETATSAGGIAGQSVQGWAARSSGFLGILVALLRSLAVLDAAVCLYAVAQALTLTAHERRRSLSVLRAQGAGRTQLLAIVAAAAACIVLASTGLAAGLERWLLAPQIAQLAASYVVLSLGAGTRLIAEVGAGMLAGAALVAAAVTHTLERQPVVAGLRSD